MTLTSPVPSLALAGGAGRPVRQGAVLACVCACTVLVVGFVAAINLAVPKLAAGALHPSATQLLWIVDAYVMLFACLVIPAGALGDRHGRKAVLIAGLLVFAAGAALSAVAGSVAVMLAGRVVTGAGAACVLPNALAVLLNATEAERRPGAIATWAAMSGIGGMAGNVGGGAVLAAGSWRLLFAAVVPIALACAVAVAAVAPRSARHDRDLRPRAVVLLTAATLALLVGIIQGPEQGWGSRLVLGAFALAVVLAAAWVVDERRAAHPLLDPRLLGIPRLRAACLGMLVVFFGMFGLFFLNASLMQYVRGFSVLKAGLAVLPLVLPLLLGARWMPALTVRFGVARVLGAAFATVAAGLLGLGAAVDGPYALYAGFLVVMGIGVTLALPPLTATIAAALPPAQAGVAGGLQAMTRELGSALGVAVVGTVLSARFTHALAARDANVERVPSSSIQAALSAAPARHERIVAAYASSAHEALTVAAGIVLVAGVLVLADLVWAGRAARRR